MDPVYLTGDALFADNERLFGLAVAKLKLSLPIDDTNLGTAPPEPDKPFAPPKLGPPPKGARCSDTIDIETAIADKIAAEAAAIRAAPEAIAASNRGTTPRPPRVSKGAQSRQEKEQKRQEREAAISAANASITLHGRRPMTHDEMLVSAKRAAKRAGGRHAAHSAIPRPVRMQQVRENPFRDVHLSNADLERLLTEATKAGHVFFPRPRDFPAGQQWPFDVSLDRLDPKGGYTIENTRLVPWIVNRARGDAWISALDEYIALTTPKAQPQVDIFERLMGLGGLSQKTRNKIHEIQTLARIRGLMAA